MDPIISGEASYNKGNAYDNEIDSIRSEIMEKIQPHLNIGMKFGVEFLYDESILCFGLIEIEDFKLDDELILVETIKLDKNDNNKSYKSKRARFEIKLIDMDSFKVISNEELEKRNMKLELEKRQGSQIDDMSKLGFNISDPDNEYKVPIEFKHDSVDHVVAISEPINVNLIIAKMPNQGESLEFEAKKKELQALKDNNEFLLEGSKIMNSIEMTLAKNTQGDLKARYDSLKESIKQPVETANNAYKESLKKLATVHNSFIDAQIKKTIVAASETRKKYKMDINKTIKAVEYRLAGKSKGILGSLKLKSSKLQNLGKSLLSDQSEIEDELAKAKRYTNIKKMLLDWSKISQDKSELSEAQIETIVEAFKIEDYEESVNAFIENLKRNTMSIISLVLKVLKSELDISTKFAPQNKDKLMDIVEKFMESLQKMNGQSSSFDNSSVEKLLKDSIDTYDHLINDVYLTPMKLYEIKDSLMSIITSAQPSMSDTDSETSTSSSNSSSSTNSSSSSSTNQRKLQKLMERNRAAELSSDTLTPVLNRIKDDVSEYIPDIKLGQVLLTTEKEMKNWNGERTGIKEKHYYLDVAGNVRKIGSTITYKLAIKDDGSIPPQLSPSSKFSQLTRLVGTSSQSQSSMPASLDDIQTQYVYPSEKESNPRFNYSRFNPLSSKPVYGPAPAPEQAQEQAPVYGPDPAPKRMITKGYNPIKGMKNFFNRTSKPTQGGKRRTRKNRKNKTRRNKKYGRR